MGIGYHFITLKPKCVGTFCPHGIQAGALLATRVAEMGLKYLSCNSFYCHVFVLQATIAYSCRTHILRHDDTVGHNKQFVGRFENTRDGTSADSLEIYGKISVLALGRSSLAAASIVDAAQANERLFFSGNPTGKPPYICIFCAIS